MTPRLCETIAVPTMAALRAARDRSAADLVELRLDALGEPASVAGALEGRRTPVIVTCRPRWEGGGFTGPEDARKAILAEALARGAEYVDVEWRAGFTDLLASASASRVVLSTHDFDGMPVDLEDRVRAMRATGAGVVKIAALPACLSDLVRLAAIGRGGLENASVVLGMGEFGVASRLLPAAFGSAWTYAGDGVAPGQLSLARMLHEFPVRRTTRATSIYGIVGRPVAHSLSPAMHNAAFRAAGVDAIYVPLPATSADDFARFAAAMGVAGASVTHPLKVDMLALADDADPVCRRVGAVNTLKREGGRWLATNTDVGGFLAPLAPRVALPKARAAVLGAGGAARAVVVALAEAGARVTVHARREAAAREVAALAGAAVGPWAPEAGTWDLLVNTTPVGTAPAVAETPFAGPFTGRLVYDLVYRPPETRLLHDAAAAGCDTIGGLDMLVAQARAQSEWWTGVKPGERLMRDGAMAWILQS